MTKAHKIITETENVIIILLNTSKLKLNIVNNIKFPVLLDYSHLIKSYMHELHEWALKWGDS